MPVVKSRESTQIPRGPWDFLAMSHLEEVSVFPMNSPPNSGGRERDVTSPKRHRLLHNSDEKDPP